MSSVTDLINLAQFKQQQSSSVDTAKRMSALADSLSQLSSKRRQQENQKKLSSLMFKSMDNLDTEYNVDETGRISVKYKPKATLSQKKQADEAYARKDLARLAKVEEPLKARIPEPKEATGWFGTGFRGEKAIDISNNTKMMARSIKTKEDLINLIENSEQLEARGVDIDQITDLYEEEILKLVQEGYIQDNEAK